MQGTYRAIGDIDFSNAPALSADLRDTIDGSDEEIVSVDCSGVTFMDSAAFHALVEVTEYAVRRGRTLVVRDLSPYCAMVLRICDCDGELHISDDPVEHEAHL